MAIGFSLPSSSNPSLSSPVLSVDPPGDRGRTAAHRQCRGNVTVRDRAGARTQATSQLGGPSATLLECPFWFPTHHYQNGNPEGLRCSLPSGHLWSLVHDSFLGLRGLAFVDPRTALPDLSPSLFQGAVLGSEIFSCHIQLPHHNYWGLVPWAAHIDNLRWFAACFQESVGSLTQRDRGELTARNGK